VKHPILGDPIYGTSYEVASDYLDEKLSLTDRIRLTGSHRLMLHANWIEFKYKSARYKIYSKEGFDSGY